MEQKWRVRLSIWNAIIYSLVKQNGMMLIPVPNGASSQCWEVQQLFWIGNKVRKKTKHINPTLPNSRLLVRAGKLKLKSRTRAGDLGKDALLFRWSHPIYTSLQLICIYQMPGICLLRADNFILAECKDRLGSCCLFNKHPNNIP